ncbi:MAG: DUF2911 domain-containing protein [Saprospiraceae bacterium]|nr:DUF2911 domain-containing protein [Saprospiraceae bacterium]
MKRSILPFLLAFFGVAAITQGQTMLIQSPNASPKASVEQTIGLTDIRIDYHRPAVNNREIWGQLVPYGTPWRAGANENTSIHFSTDVRINGADLSAGTYGLHIIPSEKESIIIFSKNYTSWGSYSYQESEDALRVPVKSEATDAFQEYLIFTFGKFTANSAVCALEWEHKKFPFTIEVDVHEVVLASIREDLRNKAGWTWQGFQEAANYCLQNEVNLQEGLGWAQRSVFMNPNSGNMITKARLTALSEGLEGDAAIDRQMAVLQTDLSSMPVTWKEYHGLANYAKRNHKLDQAMAWTDKSISMSPTMTNMMAKRDLLNEQGETKKADKVEADAISKGTNAELNNYGYALMLSGKTAEAVKIFEANTVKYPTDPNVWDSLGEGYINNGQNDKAIQALRKSLSLNPGANIKANSLRLLSQLGVSAAEINP